MLMRSFTARTMQDAMRQAREDLGDDAVILSSEKADDGGVVVTFALEREDLISFDDDIRPTGDYFQNKPPAAAPISTVREVPPHVSTSSSAIIRRIEETLLYHATPPKLVQKLIDTAKRLDLPDAGSVADVEAALTMIFSKTYRFNPLPIHEDGFRLMLVGPPGMGKTITAAKIAAKMVVDTRNLVVISTDSKRAAATEQLSAFTKILGIQLEIAESRNELRALLRDTDPSARVIIDSAGCNPYDFQELKELGEFASLNDIEPVLVCSAGVDAGEAEEIASVFSFLDIERVLISRTDCARRFGSMLAAASAGDYAYCHVTSSSKVMGELKPMDARSLSHLFTQYQRERTAA